MEAAVDQTDFATSGLTQVAAHLTSARVTLAESNAEHRSVEEQRFEELLRAYMRDEKRRFAFGGVPNLLYTASRIAEEFSQLEGDEWERCAQALDACAEKCDLKYPVTV